MITVGLTGSIAMGKSEVAQCLRAAGIAVFDADQEVHALYASAKGAQLLRDIAPDAVVNNRVDRNILARLVMDRRDLLSDIETIVHREIAQRKEEFRMKAEQEGRSLIVFDIPLLFEKSGEKGVDVTMVVSAPGSQQRQRALARPGMTAKKLDMILSRQMPDAKKRKRADYVIENDGTLEQLCERTLAAISAIRKAHTL